MISGEKTFRAGWIAADSEKVIRNGYVTVVNGTVRELGKWSETQKDNKVIDLGEGVIIPSLVNAHTHLELSSLEGKLPFGVDFSVWVGKLLALREELGNENLLTGAASGIKKLISSSCSVVGEISTLGITYQEMVKHGLTGVWFRELLGNKAHLPDTDLEKMEKTGLLYSAAAHAPHTTSPELLVYLKHYALYHRRPFSIHLAESDEEFDFVTTGKGSWAEFLKSRKIDFSTWGLPAKSPVSYLDKMDLLDPGTIAVHVIRAGGKDLEILANKGTRVCLCVRSNKNLHGFMPDIPAMLKLGIRPCLGTDSLASNYSLSLFDEIREISRIYPEISPEKLFDMATLYGAEALGLSRLYGTIAPEKKASLFYLPISANNKDQIFERMIDENHPESVNLGTYQ